MYQGNMNRRSGIGWIFGKYRWGLGTGYSCVWIGLMGFISGYWWPEIVTSAVLLVAYVQCRNLSGMPLLVSHTSAHFISTLET
jgi:hypothetical protein